MPLLLPCVLRTLFLRSEGLGALLHWLLTLRHDARFVDDTHCFVPFLQLLDRLLVLLHVLEQLLLLRKYLSATSVSAVRMRVSTQCAAELHSNVCAPL